MVATRSSDLLARLLAETHLIVPDDLPALLTEYAKPFNAVDVALYLVDYDQRLLVPLPTEHSPTREPVLIDATVAGRCFRTLKIHQTDAESGGGRIWCPVIDGTERLGVLRMDFAAPGVVGEEIDEDVLAFAGLVAELVVTKAAYGDFFERVRRRQPMSIAAELAWQLLPPLTFGSDRVVISGALIPAYELGGDSFDYGVDAQTARVAVFDAMGHGLEAGLLATVAVAAYRNSRRLGASLSAAVVAIDDALSHQFGPERFVTAVLAELDLGSGLLRWSVAGHPPPLLLRRNKIVKTLEGNVGLPLGLGLHAPVAEEVLEPGDQLLFITDGVIEARSSEGEFFGVDRLVDLIGRASSSQDPPPETLRRLIHAILEHQGGDLQDDATAVLVEWKGQGIEALKVPASPERVPPASE